MLRVMSTQEERLMDAPFASGLHAKLVERAVLEMIRAFAWAALGRYGLCHADRSEVAQEVVIRAWQRLAVSHEDRESVRRWVVRCVRYEAGDFFRKRCQQRLTFSSDG